MNTKRQTVWLVSMLSLMVVLSAYYLFTEDVNELDLTTQQLTGNEIKVDAVKTGTNTGAQGAAKATNGTAATGSAANGSGKTDAEVLKQVSAKASSGNDFFASAQLKRIEQMSKEAEKLYAITVDSKKSNTEVNQALEKLQLMQDLDEKITGIEDWLMKDFKNAIVLEESGKWQVVVQTAKLEKSQGVSIVDMVTKELNVTPDKVTIKYVP